MEQTQLENRWEQFNDRLEFEIGKVEHQLAGVNARLRDMKRSLWIYALFFIAPFVILKLVKYLREDWIMMELMRTNNAALFSVLQIVYSILTIAWYVLLPVGILSLPLFGSYFIRALKRYRRHKKSNSPWELPRERLSLHEGRHRQETNCYIEREKLIWVLNKYYLYRSKMKDLHKKIICQPPEMTLEQLETHLSAMVFYEEIRPAISNK